ncbi:hypothetical protein D3C80_1595690 [compost metagenome]
MSAGIQPGETTAENFDTEVFLVKVGTVHIGNFQLTALGGLDALGDLDDVVVVEVKAGDGITGLGLGRFFFDAERSAVGIELNHTEALRVGNMVTKYRGAIGLFSGGAQVIGEMLTVENVVAKDQAARVFANELFTNDERLCQAVRAWLLGIAELHAILATVAQ